MTTFIASFVLIVLTMVAMMLGRALSSRGQDHDKSEPACGQCGCAGVNRINSDSKEANIERSPES
jgi:hypothetical protein